jgi:hypothetical protein
MMSGKSLERQQEKDNKTSQRHSCDDVTSGVKKWRVQLYNILI